MPRHCLIAIILLRGVARSLLQLLQFVELNATGLRKILKKFDRRVGGQGTMLTGGYVSSRSQHPYSHLQQMFKQVVRCPTGGRVGSGSSTPSQASSRGHREETV